MGDFLKAAWELGLFIMGIGLMLAGSLNGDTAQAVFGFGLIFIHYAEAAEDERAHWKSQRWS